MTIQKRIEELKKKFIDFSIDYFLVPSNDEFQSEYVADHLNRLKYISGFTGSNGIAIIGKKENLFFTDGRYLLQAKQELDNNFIIHDIGNILHYLPKGRIGYDPKLHTKASIDYYREDHFVSCADLIDLPPAHSEADKKIFSYPLKYAGETLESKSLKIQAYLQEKQIDALIITDSTNVCWLLNIRANAVTYNPILLSYLIFHQDGNIELFSSAKAVEDVQCYSLKEFYERVAKIADKKVQVDIHTASIELLSKLNNPIITQDPCLILKACKNRIEIIQAKKIHVADGVAVTKLLYWLEKNYLGKTELDIVQKLLEFRALHSNFISPSFATIAAFASNGAIIHYSPKDKTNKTIENNGLFLLDSGGQYFGGTTDITRVIAIGKPTYQQKLDFTLVLKGHIALANSVFPKGTTGAQLDALARYFLWQYKKDYPHGTGHGVGNCLSVHEGPQRISKFSNVILEPGMILSNEPGFYKENEYGIRIENLMLVKEYSDNFLCFETLTLAPIDTRLVLFNLLSQLEKKWLEKYHHAVYGKLSKFLELDEKKWLKKFLNN